MGRPLPFLRYAVQSWRNEEGDDAEAPITIVDLLAEVNCLVRAVVGSKPGVN